MKRFLIGTLSAFWFLAWSCVTPINPRTQSMASKLVVDGLITDQIGRSRISLTQTADYTAASLNLTVQRATVFVTDQNGTRTIFREARPGFYLPVDPNWRGTAGQTYTLNIRTAEGKEYKSQPDLLKSVPPIDSVYWEYTRKPLAGTADFDKGFNVYIDTKDPKTEGDYFRWSWVHYEPIGVCDIRTVPRTTLTFSYPCCSNCWDIVRCYSCVTLASDEIVNGNVISRQPVLRAPFESMSKYYVEIEQYSLSRSAYQYWKTVRELTNNRGGIFDPAPVTLRGNMTSTTDPSEPVFGFFGASGSSVRAVTIDRSQTGDSPNLRAPLPPFPDGLPPCAVCVDNDFRTPNTPRWWTN